MLAALPVWASPRSYPLPDPRDALVGALEQRELRYEDTLAAVAQVEGVGFDALRRANETVDAWLPGEGAVIDLPTWFILPDAQRDGIVVNLSELRLYYFDTGRSRLHVYPVGIGVEGAETPLGVTRTLARIENPEWTPPLSIRIERAAVGDFLPRVVPPGPENPLGSFAIRLGIPGYFIHGTNQPFGVGRRVSHGCIRLYDRHIAALAHDVPNGTTVRLVRQRHKVGWRGGELFLESHPGDGQDDPRDLTGAVRRIVDALRLRSVDVDWDAAMAIARSATGIPGRISR